MTPVATKTKPTLLVQKFQACMAEDMLEVVERDAEIKILYRCLLAKVHPLFLGDPGIAKSLMLRLMHGHVPEAPYYETLVFKQSPADSLIGQISVKGLKNDEYRRVTKGKLPEAYLAMVDEVWKSTSSALNALLPILAEGIFHNDGEPEDVPLWFCAFASNELPGHERDDLRALRDRIAVTRVVEDVRTDESYIELLEGQLARTRGEVISPTLTELTIAEIEQAQEDVGKIVVDDDMKRTLAKFRRECHNAGFMIRPRRLYEGIRMGLANAYLAGRTEMIRDDIRVFEDIIWREPEEREDAHRVLVNYQSPYEREAAKLRNGFTPLNKEFAELKSDGPVDVNDKDRFQQTVRLRQLFNKQMEEVNKQIEYAQKDNEDSSALDELATDIQRNSEWLNAQFM